MKIENDQISKYFQTYKIFGKPRVRLENEVSASPYSNYLISNTKVSSPFQKIDVNSQTSIAVDFNQRHNIGPSHFSSGNGKVAHHFSIKKEIEVTIYPLNHRLQDNLSRFQSYLFKDIPQTQKSMNLHNQPRISISKNVEHKKSKFGQSAISKQLIQPQQQLQRKELKRLRKEKKKLQKMLRQQKKQLEKAHHRASQEIRRLNKQQCLCSCCSQDEQILQKLEKMYIQLHSPVGLKTYKITSNPEYALSSSQSSLF